MSTKISRLKDYRLRNEEHFQHKRTLKTLLGKFPQVIDQLGELNNTFANLLQQEEEVLEKIRKSDLTAQIAEADRLRDETTSGMFHIIDGYSLHWDRQVRQDAVGVQIIRNHYAGVQRQTIDSQTAATHNMIQDLNGKGEIIGQMHLTEWIGQLLEDNKEVIRLLASRNSEVAARQVSQLTQLRPQIDDVCKQIFLILESFAILKPSADLKTLTDEINTLNKRYTDTVAQRKGAAEARKAKRTEEN